MIHMILISIIELIIVGFPWIVGYILLIVICKASDRKYSKDMERRKGYQPTLEELKDIAGK